MKLREIAEGKVFVLKGLTYLVRGNKQIEVDAERVNGGGWRFWMGAGETLTLPPETEVEPLPEFAPERIGTSWPTR